MKSLPMIALLAALTAASAACSKDKKETTTPTQNEPVAATPEAPPETPEAPDAPPAPDPASLEEIIYFEFDSSELSDEARTRLNENAEWLKEDDARSLTIEGHTDEVGTPEYNLGLGERRARAAKDYLVRMGIAEGRIDIITYGEERPASPDDPQNRRSVFVATKK